MKKCPTARITILGVIFFSLCVAASGTATASPRPPRLMKLSDSRYLLTYSTKFSARPVAGRGSLTIQKSYSMGAALCAFLEREYVVIGQPSLSEDTRENLLFDVQWQSKSSSTTIEVSCFSKENRPADALEVAGVHYTTADAGTARSAFYSSKALERQAEEKAEAERARIAKRRADRERWSQEDKERELRLLQKAEEKKARKAAKKAEKDAKKP